MKASFQTRLNSIKDSQFDAIRDVNHFRDSQYNNLDIRPTLEFFFKRYVQQIFKVRQINNTTVIADIGTGYAWLPITFALSSNAKIIAVDADEERLNAGRKIAEILGVANQIDWRTGLLGDLPMKDREADVTYCIEVLEHVQRNSAAVKDLARVTSEYLVFTTPNLWFPKIAHDTQLLFCHWLPMRWRQLYAKMFDRTDRENDNLFWSIISINSNLKEFKRESNFLHYESYKHYLNTLPFYLPYGTKAKHISHISFTKKYYYMFASLFGRLSVMFLPNLAGTYKRTIN